MKRNNRHIRNFVLTAVASSIFLLNQSAWALQALPDHDLRQIDGQDGISINTEYSKIDVDQLYWEDTAGTAAASATKLKATANDVKIRKNNSTDILGTAYEVQVGANAGNKPGIDLKIESRPSTISIKDFSLCRENGSCDPSIGNLAIQTASPLEIRLKTSDGLFNQNAQAELTLGLRNINIYTGLATATANTFNQLILKNTNFNFFAKGVAYIDATGGFIMHTNTGGTTDPATSIKASKTQTPVGNTTYGYVDFARVALPDQTGKATATYLNTDGDATGSGLNLEFMLKQNAVIDPTNPVYSVDNAKGLIRVGASGRMVNSFLQIRGIDASNTTTAAESVLGYATAVDGTGSTNPIIGSSGIALRLRGEFTTDNDTMLGSDGEATTLEIGGAGTNSYGFEFGQLEPLLVGSADRAYFDSGSVYVNLADTKHLLMPENTVLNTARFGGQTNTYLTDETDYVQQVHGATDKNPVSAVIAVRDANFQAISKRGRFTSNAGLQSGVTPIAPTAGSGNQWGLGLPFYNLNANAALYSTTYTGDVFGLSGGNVSKSSVTNSSRIGLSLALSVEGRDTNGTKTTSILLIDGGDRDSSESGIQPTNYYMGLRNIDMLLRGYGTVGLENGNFNAEFKDLLMVMVAELAAGYLPGAKYKSTGADVPLNVFASKADVLAGLKIKLLGDINFALIPNNSVADGSRLSVVGQYKLTDGTLQISDPIDESMIGFDRMSGLIQFNNAIVVNSDTVGFNFGLEFNPAAGQTAEQRAANVFRVRDINFYPPLEAPTGWNTTTMGAYNNRGQRLGELVMTGGRLNAEMSIRPRN